MNTAQPSTGFTPADQVFPPPALRPPTLRSAPAALVGRVAQIQQKALVHRTAGETALLEGFDLARAYPGELAHLLAGVRAGLYAAGVGREQA